jgi:hypothetical protein
MAAALLGSTVLAGAAAADPIKTVFVISMENENFIQPANPFTASNEQIFNNPNAPFINSLIDGTATAVSVGGTPTNISAQTAYAANYHNVLSDPAGTVHIHPSEPNYIWSEAGSNLGVLNDNTPFSFPAGTTVNNKTTDQHLSGLMQQQGVSWKAYQEDIDLVAGTNAVKPQDQWTVPLSNVSGTNAGYTNAYNGSHQFDYAVKHLPEAFFTDTNGGPDQSTSNPQIPHYAPLQQLQADLDANTVAQYNWITPDQFNDMHTALSGTFMGLTNSGDKRIKQGDNFLAQIVPMIMASQAYQDGGAIVLWWDETEPDGAAGDNPDNFDHFLTEIVISPLAHANVGGLPYASDVLMTHSSDLRTWQNLFGLYADNGYLGDAAFANDLSDLFAAGAVPLAFAPEPGTMAVLPLGLVGFGLLRRRRA